MLHFLSSCLVFFDTANSYRDRFAMMAESIARERYEIEVREKAQRKVFISFLYRFTSFRNMLHYIHAIVSLIDILDFLQSLCFRFAPWLMSPALSFYLSCIGYCLEQSPGKLKFLLCRDMK